MLTKEEIQEKLATAVWVVSGFLNMVLVICLFELLGYPAFEMVASPAIDFISTAIKNIITRYY